MWNLRLGQFELEMELAWMVAVLLLLTCPITQQHPGNPDHQDWVGGGGGTICLLLETVRAPSLREGRRKGDPPHCFPGAAALELWLGP